MVLFLALQTSQNQKSPFLLWKSFLLNFCHVLFLVGIVVHYSTDKLNHYRESIKTLVTTASNTWGLFFMVLLMGYGLVEVPRYVWDLSRREHRLRRTYFQVAKLHSEKSDATESLEDVLDVGTAAAACYCHYFCGSRNDIEI